MNTICLTICLLFILLFNIFFGFKMSYCTHITFNNKMFSFIQVKSVSSSIVSRTMIIVIVNIIMIQSYTYVHFHVITIKCNINNTIHILVRCSFSFDDINIYYNYLIRNRRFCTSIYNTTN